MSDARMGQTKRYVSAQIEHEMTRLASRLEEAIRRIVFFEERLGKRILHLIGRLHDARSETSLDAFDGCAKLHHLCDSVFENTAERPAPSRMCRTYNGRSAGLFSGEKNRPAIRGQNPYRKLCNIGDKRIAFRTRFTDRNMRFY